MLQVAIAAAAGLLLVGSFALGPHNGSTLLTPSPKSSGPVLEVAGDGVNVALPSSQATMQSGFGTPIAGASPMPSAKAFTHTMFDQ